MSAESSSLALPLLWIVFAVTTLLSAAIGIIISYHWTRFAGNPAVSFFTIAVYASGCVVLLGIMFASLAAIS